MCRRDREISAAIWEFTRRLREIHPQAMAVIKDFKWDEEDVYIEVKIPPMTEEEETELDHEGYDIHDRVGRVADDIFEEKDVYILALVHPDKAEV
jgi:hypothetical protein